MKKILYLTDLAYQAKGRNYCEEDIYITSHLKDRYDIALCHPKCSLSFEKDADLIVFRNTGGVSGFKEIYDSFVQRVKENGLNTFNTFSGKADMRGKQYLLELTRQNYPVIPTVDTITCTDTGGNIPASWEVFVKSLSTLHVNVSASGAYGSTITGYLIEALNQSVIQNNVDIGVIDSSGSVTVEVTVTDSRGRTGTATATISVVDYDIPEIESCVVERTNSQGIPTENGTFLRVTLGCSVSSVDHHNEMTVRIYYKASTDDDRTLARTIHEDGVISIQGEIFMISGMNVAKTYTIEVEVQDIITAAPTKISGIIQSEGAIISCRYGGTGIAFGRTAETAYQADFGWEIRGRQGAIFDTPLLPASGGTGVTSLQALIGELLDYIYPVGSLYWSSRSTDPGTLFGGTWTPITDRFVLAAGPTYSAGGSGGAASVSHKHLAPVGYNANHTHGIIAINGTVAGGNGAHYETATAPNYGTLSGNVTMPYTGNESISTMPPYVVKYCWERTA